jgi:hypothetical protein
MVSKACGRKNWNGYLLRHGRCVVFYEWWEHEADRGAQLEHKLKYVKPEQWPLEPSANVVGPV